MNYKEAIEQLKRVSKNLGAIGETTDLTDIAIDALEKLELINNWIDLDEAIIVAELVHRYGIDAVKEACEKQIPNVPYFYDGDYIGSEHFSGYKCQNCGEFVNYKKNNYCSNCGQKIDWGKEDAI